GHQPLCPPLPSARVPQCSAKAGTQRTTKSSQCAFEITMRRSGSSARNLAPISRIAALTRATCALSSVAGSVRNCGACGTIAAPTMPALAFPFDFSLICFLALLGWRRSVPRRLWHAEARLAGGATRRHLPLTMPKPLTVLGIETSCDETAVAIVTDPAPSRIRANLMRSQLAEHSPYGGVVPEI